MGRDSNAPHATAGFGVTRWSLVAASLDRDPKSSRQALLELCLRYWYPVFAYVRRCRHAPDAAHDVTRAFFEHLLAAPLPAPAAADRGRFRDFLLDELQKFLAADWRAARPQESTPDLVPPAGAEELESRNAVENEGIASPEQAFRRSFALHIVAQALERLRREATAAGRETMYEALEPLLTVDAPPGELERIAERLAIRPLAALMALKRLRQRFRELVDAELAETVDGPDQLAAERDALRAALAP